MIFFRLVPVVGLLLMGCEQDDAPPPTPVELTSDAVGHYCSMVVAEHPGPKAQIFVSEAGPPLWFPSVRDMFAYTMLPEENQDVRAIYVSDTGASENIEMIAEGAWIEARHAFYVLGSEITGGMGLPETVPFANREQAIAFAQQNGGDVASFDEVTTDHIFAELDAEPPTAADKL